jgi:hypothetical protein
MNGDTKSKWLSKTLTLAFAVAVVAVFAALLTQGDALAFAEVNLR